MPILKNWFRRVKESIKRASVDRPARMRQAAQEVGDMLFKAAVERQPIGRPDSWDQSTTSSERQGHTAISAGWGEGPEVFHRSEEGVDVVGLSILSGSHLPITKKVVTMLRQVGLDDVLVVVGGVIPKGDVSILKSHGAHGVFPFGSHLEEIIEFIKQKASNKDKRMS